MLIDKLFDIWHDFVLAAHHFLSEVDVNEQNQAARGFYEKMGFWVYARDEADGQSSLFPILHMRLK